MNVGYINHTWGVCGTCVWWNSFSLRGLLYCSLPYLTGNKKCWKQKKKKNSLKVGWEHTSLWMAILEVFWKLWRPNTCSPPAWTDRQFLLVSCLSVLELKLTKLCSLSVKSSSLWLHVFLRTHMAVFTQSPQASRRSWQRREPWEYFGMNKYYNFEENWELNFV